MEKNILFICGSLNQTTMMHKIASHLTNHNCLFTPFYAIGLPGLLAEAGLLDFTILGGNHRRECLKYLQEHNLPIDYRGKNNTYDLVITGTDLLIQQNIRSTPILLVQEGMTEPENFLYHLVKYLKFPRFIANTAATGMSDAYVKFCVASSGYRDLFISKGVKAEKITITGIPNFDNVKENMENDFPSKDFVLVATSSIRETLKMDNRIEFLLQAKEIAGDQQVIFKLHPNENHARARAEIRKVFPQALIYSKGNIGHMIANCSCMVAQTSSVVYMALALNKPLFSYFDNKTLQKLCPIQNGGLSAKNIANVCLHTLTNLPAKQTPARPKRQPHWDWEFSSLRKMQ